MKQCQDVKIEQSMCLKLGVFGIIYINLEGYFPLLI